MTWGLLALIIVVALFGGCAIAFGNSSMAQVNAETKTRREVVPDTPVIEEVLIQKEKAK